MEEAPVTYMITSIAPVYINEIMWNIRKNFNANPPHIKTSMSNIVALDTAHITIKSQFYLRPSADEEMLLRTLDTVKMEPFTIHANTLDVFRSKNLGNVVVAVIDKNIKMQRLHEKVFKAVEPYIETSTQYEYNDYKAHLSIMYTVPESIVDNVKMYAEQTILPISYTITNFSLLRSISGISKERIILKKYSLE